MSEIKKLTVEELKSIKSLKQEYNNLAFALGELELQRENINKERQRLLDIKDHLIKNEEELGKTLTDKYGTGSINIETGEINQ